MLLPPIATLLPSCFCEGDDSCGVDRTQSRAVVRLALELVILNYTTC